MTDSTAAAQIWENYICLNSAVEKKFETLGPASQYLNSDSRVGSWVNLDYSEALRNDTYPLPNTEDREGYYDQDHFSYWASGLLDARMLMDTAQQLGIVSGTYLDLGCASGRVTRHTALQYRNLKTLGCDINRLHVEWCNAFLPKGLVTFQNHSIPSLPLESNSIDIVSAYSVFTHIEAMETTWLMEIRRVLRPGGIAWVTLHTEGTLQDMTPDWPLWSPVMQHPESGNLVGGERSFDGNRLVLRWSSARSYSSNVFYKAAYIRANWSRIFEVVDIRRRHPGYQDVVILRKS